MTTPAVPIRRIALAGTLGRPMTGDRPTGHVEAALHDAALAAALAAVGGIPDDRWDDPTPCSEWTVRDVVGHLAWGNLVLAEAIRGAPFRERADGRTIALPAPPLTAYRGTVADVRQALGTPTASNEVAFPTGTIPLRAALRIRVQDLVVHMWDLSVSTGTTPRIDDTLIAAAERTARERHGAGQLPPSQFAPPGDLTTAASGLDVLLLTVGRDPRWSSPVRRLSG